MITTWAKSTRLVHISNIQSILVYKGFLPSIFHTGIYSIAYKRHDIRGSEHLLHMSIIRFIVFCCSDTEHEIFTFS